MKVIDTKKEDRLLKFDEMAGGDVFYYGERENLFMILEFSVCATQGEYFNAISLVNGDLVWFDCDELVHSVEAELVLK